MHQALVSISRTRAFFVAGQEQHLTRGAGCFRKFAGGPRATIRQLFFCYLLTLTAANINTSTPDEAVLSSTNHSIIDICESQLDIHAPWCICKALKNYLAIYIDFLIFT
jgi:hypothetical protein